MDRQKLLKNGIFVLIALAGVGLAVGYGRHLMRVDPFSRFAKSPLTSNSVMAKMKDVDVVQYNRDKLVGQAHVGELDVNADSRTFDLNRVDSGALYTDRGRIDFAADSAVWDSGRLYLIVNSGAEVQNKDFDLKAESFNFDQSTGNLVVPKQIHGRFFGGEISAKQFLYNTNTENGRVGPATWVGKPNLQEDTGQASNTKWTFQTNGITISKGDMEVWDHSTATDGEIVVQADTIQRNKKTDVITATGNCLYFSAKANMACDKVVVYRQEKRAVLTGNVRMLIKPKDSMEKQPKVDMGEIPVFHPEVPDKVAAEAPLQSESQSEKDLDDEVRSGKTTRKYPTVVLAEQVEYWYAKGGRHAVITGSPQATQQLAGTRWRKVWANKALYDGEKDTVRLESTSGKSDVIMKNSTGDDIKAVWFEFSTQENNEDWTGQGITGSVVQTEDEDNPAQPSTTPPVTPTPGGNPLPPSNQGGNKPPAKTISQMQAEQKKNPSPASPKKP